MANDEAIKRIFSTNLKRYMAQSGTSQTQLAKICGVSQQSVSNWLNEKQIPRMGAIEKLASYYNILKSDLLEEKDISKIANFPELKNIFPVPEMHKVPLIGAIACGEPIYADQEYGYIETSVKADFCLRAQGDSMTGARIRNGDIVYCLAQPEVQNGEIAAVIIDDEATLKRFYFYGDTIVLHPENPDFQDLVYRGEEMAAVRILGKAIEFRGKVR